MQFFKRLSQYFNREVWLGFIALALSTTLIVKLGFVADANRNLLDAAFKYSRLWFPEPVRMDPVIVGIDEAFLASIDEPITLSHFYLTEFFQAMAQAKPSVVGVDLDLPDKRFESLVSKRNPDMDYHRTLLGGLLKAVQELKIIVVKVWDRGQQKFHEIQVDYAFVLGTQEHQPAIASAMFAPDPDNRYRRYPGPDLQPDGTQHTLTSEMSAAIGRRGEWSGLINFRLGERFSYVPLQDVLKWSKDGDIKRLQQTFGGKPVLLGVVLEDMDILPLPVPMTNFRKGETDTRAPGVLAHAQVLRSMWNGGLIKETPNEGILALCLLFSLFWFGDSVLKKGGLLLLASIGLFALSSALFLQNIWLAPMAILLTGWLAFAARSALQGWAHFQEKQNIKQVFSGSVSPAVMQAMIKGGIDAVQKSSRLPVCVLFADIRNFTTMCEHMQAEEVVSLLNRYFARMVHVIHEHGGTVDKFIGDGLMAFFGAPNPLDVPEKHALEAARGMHRELQELNRELAAEGKAQLNIGIGLHSGEAVIGQIGSAERHEYTAIGDTVNTASRIEGLCKDVGRSIVCSENVAAAVGFPEDLVALGERPLKGRAAIAVYGWTEVATGLGTKQDHQPMAPAAA